MVIGQDIRKAYKIKLGQIGGKSVDCNNTQLLYNRLGSCWNTAIQSIYAFYLDSFDSILGKTGRQLYNEAKENNLIEYLPRYWISSKEEIIIEMLDSMIKRWKNKKNKPINKSQYIEEDSECEVKSVGLFVKEIIGRENLKNKDITKENLYKNVDAIPYVHFFMHLIINVFFCKEIYDFTFYTYKGDLTHYEYYFNLTKLNTDTFMRLDNSKFIEDSMNDDNLIGIECLLKRHSTCIVKCSGSKYGNFNNYYDDNFEKLYTINYEEFRQTIINAKDLLSKPNTKLEFLKPNGENVRIVLIDDNTGKIINRQTDSMKQKYLKYKQKYLKYKHNISYTYEGVK